MKDNNIAAKTGKELAREFGLWEQTRKDGGSDPFWPDGTGMNLIRNHIISLKRTCEAELLPEEYPPEYFRETPPEVDNNYMARAKEIRERAGKSLEAYKADSDYQYLREAVTKLTKQQKAQTCILYVLNYVAGLENAITQDRLVDMRRHERPENYLDSFRECRKRVDAILENPDREQELPQGQLSLFDLFGLT